VVTGGDLKGRLKSLAPAPRTLFNASITNQRSYATFTAPIAEIKAMGKRHGGTLNDTVLALCSTAMKSFLDERGGAPKGSLVAAVPVSLREAGDATMNNQVSMMTVSLATDVSDVGERFKAIKASSTASKSVVNSVRGAIPTDLPVLGSPWMMGGFASLYGRSGLADRAPPQANVVVSNVPFSPVTLYLAGAKMLSAYAVSIPYHGMALNVTVQSYGEFAGFRPHRLPAGHAGQRNAVPGEASVSRLRTAQGGACHGGDQGQGLNLAIPGLNSLTSAIRPSISASCQTNPPFRIRRPRTSI